MSTTTDTPATAHLKDLLTTLQKQWNISMDGPDEERETRTLRSALICDRFSSAYLLAQLIRIDPDTADLAVKELTGMLEDGGAIGECTWHMLKGFGIDPVTLQGGK